MEVARRRKLAVHVVGSQNETKIGGGIVSESPIHLVGGFDNDYNTIRKLKEDQDKRFAFDKADDIKELMSDFEHITGSGVGGIEVAKMSSDQDHQLNLP